MQPMGQDVDFRVSPSYERAIKPYPAVTIVKYGRSSHFTPFRLGE